MEHNHPNQFHNRTATEEKIGVNHEENRSLRALHILELLGRSSSPLTLSLIAYRAGVPKSTVLRLLRTMEASGFILKIPGSESYTIGPQTVKLSFDCLNSNTFLQAVRSILRDLVNILGETCNFTIPFENQVLYLDRVNTSEVLRLHFDPGRRVPMYCTASGKLFLSSFNQKMLNNFYEEIQLTPLTRQTITSQPQLNQDLEDIKIRGYSTDNEEFIAGMCALAIPIKDSNGNIVAAIACHAPTARISLKQLIECRSSLKDAGKKIEKLFINH